MPGSEFTSISVSSLPAMTISPTVNASSPKTPTDFHPQIPPTNLMGWSPPLYARVTL